MDIYGESKNFIFLVLSVKHEIKEIFIFSVHSLLFLAHVRSARWVSPMGFINAFVRVFTKKTMENFQRKLFGFFPI